MLVHIGIGGEKELKIRLKYRSMDKVYKTMTVWLKD